MKNISRSLLLSLTAFLFQQCGVSLHTFNTTNAPDLTEKKEKNVNGFLGGDHVEAQVAFSPKEKVGALVNAYGSFGGNPYSLGSTLGTFIVEGALGHYSLIKKNWYYDIYGGLGFGERHYSGLGFESVPYGGRETSSYKVSSMFEKGFIQSSIFYKKGRNELALTAQGACFYFNSVDIRLTGYGNQPPSYFTASDPGNYYSRNNFAFLNLNLALTLKHQINRIILIMQMATNQFDPPFNYDHANFHFYTRYPIEMNIGLAIDFPPQKKSEVIPEKAN